MIRSRDWKLVWRYPSGPHELYNVAEDPNEFRNLFSRPGHTARIRNLREQLDHRFAAYVDPALDDRALPVTGRGQRDHAFAYSFPRME